MIHNFLRIVKDLLFGFGYFLGGCRIVVVDGFCYIYPDYFMVNKTNFAKSKHYELYNYNKLDE